MEDYLPVYEEDVLGLDEDFYFPVPEPPLAPRKRRRRRTTTTTKEGGREGREGRRLASRVVVVGGLEGGMEGREAGAGGGFPLTEGAIPVPKEGIVEGGGEGGRRHEAGEHEHEQGGHEEYGPGCHPVCEPEPNHAVEMAEFFAMALFTIDYLIRLLCVHAVPYRLLDSNGYAKRKAAVRRGREGGEEESIHFNSCACITFFTL